MNDVTKIPDTNQAVSIPDDPNSVMNLIAEMARGGQIDVVKELVALRNSMEDRNARLSFARDYAPMKAKLPKIIKNKTNSHTKSDYADLSQINEAVDPVLGEFGFATTQKVIAQTPTSITIHAELLHREGHTESMDITFPIDDKGSGGNTNKTVIQGMASTISYLKRVAKCTILDIAAGEDADGNDQPHESQYITIEQAVDIDTRLRALGGDRDVFLKYLGADKVEEIPKCNYRKAIANLNGKEAKIKEQQAAEVVKS